MLRTGYLTTITGHAAGDGTWISLQMNRGSRPHSILPDTDLSHKWAGTTLRYKCSRRLEVNSLSDLARGPRFKSDRHEV